MKEIVQQQKQERDEPAVDTQEPLECPPAKKSQNKSRKRFDKEAIKSFLYYANIKIHIKLGRAKFFGFGVLKIGNTVVKVTRMRTTEAASTTFVRNNTSIPVPRVLNVFKREDRTYTVMEYINAPNLEMVWASLTSEQKRDILQQLKGYLDELRLLQPPSPGRIEAVDGSALRDLRMGGFQEKGNFGPFATIDDFHTHFGHDYVRLNPETLAWCQPKFERISGKSYCTKFTHADLGIYNVLVRDGKIAAIIDWEFAGWYPEYWEYTRSLQSNWRYPDVLEMLHEGEMMDVYKDEEGVEDCLNTLFIRC